MIFWQWSKKKLSYSRISCSNIFLDIGDNVSVEFHFPFSLPVWGRVWEMSLLGDGDGAEIPQHQKYLPPLPGPGAAADNKNMWLPPPPTTTAEIEAEREEQLHAEEEKIFKIFSSSFFRRKFLRFIPKECWVV